jgi:acetyl-CoA carboxylase biotin carboxyl carrier protein
MPPSNKPKPPKLPAAAPSSSASAPIFGTDHVRALAEIVESHGLSELVLELPEGTLQLRRGSAAPALGLSSAPAHPAAGMSATSLQQLAPAYTSSPPAAPAPAAPVAPAGHEVQSPFVGTFYRSPGPESPAFVEIGQRVRKGQVLCIVEAMKLMNEIESEVDGTIVATPVENAQPVEYGQVLFRIATASAS